MVHQEKIYQLFIASPGDAKDERNLIERVVEEINREHQGVSLVPVRWEHDPPNLNQADTQAVINERLKTCDVMVAVFRNRVGTATARAIGGAVEEIRDFEKHILQYLYAPNEQRLKEELRPHIPNLENATWKTYTELSELERTLRTNIASWFNAQIKPLSAAPTVRLQKLMIEEELPVNEIGIESVRERAVAMDLPPLFALHVWWARRPLVASAAAILGSLMPAWSPELADKFADCQDLESRRRYRAWFLQLCGILGDPVEARRQIDAAKAEGRATRTNAYGYKQAYKNSPTQQDLTLLHRILKYTWNDVPSVLDPTAGGGSIPFEAIRYRLPARANDLNSVAAAVLRAGIEVPSIYDETLVEDTMHWGQQLVERLKNRLLPYFASNDPARPVRTYIWARTVACPRTGKTVPLVSDWRLRSGANPVAVRLITSRNGVDLDEPEFELLEGRAIGTHLKFGATWKNGKAISPWDQQVIDGSYIRQEAQQGRIGEILYATASGRGKDHGFNSPTAQDLASCVAAEAELKRLLPDWEARDILPHEKIPKMNDRRPKNYGMTRWRDMFTDRQLLVHGCFVEEFQELSEDVRDAYPEDTSRADAILAMISMMQGKALNYNSRQSSWTVSRAQMRSSFDRHAFPFRTTFAEFEGAVELFDWILNRQLLRAVKGIVALLKPSDSRLDLHGSDILPNPQIVVTQNDAGALSDIADGSQQLVCMDPPYYDNVMYAELADYFYIWEKRTLGKVWTDLFESDLTDKDREAVASKARHSSRGRDAASAADVYYRTKMLGIFRECHRVLSTDGVLTVMFTHKRTDAWNALGSALLEAGFTIETSWPVRTESEQSLHQARSNSVTSTIFLVCRKRHHNEEDSAPRMTYLDEIRADIRKATRDAYSRSDEQGLEGVDLLLSTYGPALSVLSLHWPVYSEDESDERARSRLLRPEEALHEARSEVTRLIKLRLLGKSEGELDAVTDFYVLAWKIFGARDFPFDEARRLALAVGGLEIDALVRDRLIAATGGTVTLCEPHQRLRGESEEALSGVSRNAERFPVVVDAVHTALYLVAGDGLGEARRWLNQRNLANDQRFLDCLQALVNAVPRSKNNKGDWNVAEAGLLDRLITAYFPSITVPPDPLEHQQQTMSVS